MPGTKLGSKGFTKDTPIDSPKIGPAEEDLISISELEAVVR